METCSEFFMASKNAAPEHCNNYNVAGFSLEFERLDDDQGTKRENCELECENGGERDWCEEASVYGNGPVKETLAQDGSSMDREVQHERRVCHQRTSTQLGWSCCQNGLQRDLCEGLGLHPQRYKIYRWKDMVAAEVSKLTGNANGFSESVQKSTGACTSRPCELETVCQIWEEPCLGAARCLFDPSASSMVWTGAAGSLWRRMAAFGVENWSRPRIWTTERVSESVRFGELLLHLFASSQS